MAGASGREGPGKLRPQLSGNAGGASGQSPRVTTDGASGREGPGRLRSQPLILRGGGGLGVGCEIAPMDGASGL